MLIVCAVALLLASSAKAQTPVKKIIFETCEVQYGTHILDTHSADQEAFWQMDGDPIQFKTTFVVTNKTLKHYENGSLVGEYVVHKPADYLITDGDVYFHMIDENEMHYNFKYVKNENVIYFNYSNGFESRVTKFYLNTVKYK